MYELKTLSNFLQFNDSVEGTSKDPVFYDLDVLKLYYKILEQVEKDPFRYWNIGSLRNYLWAFYMLSNTLSGEYRYEGHREISDRNNGYSPTKIIGINIFVGDEYALFFTGLYSRQRKNGLKEGLYILCQKKGNNIERKVFTNSELLSFNSDISKDLNKIKIEETFEKEFTPNSENAPKALSNIIMPLKFDNDKIALAELKNKKEELSQSSKGKKQKLNNNWLHILVDGVDNVPTDFLKLLYNKPTNKHFSQKDKMQIVVDSILQKEDSFYRYEDCMLKAIEESINDAKKDGFNQLPLNYYMNGKGNPFQYLLPIDFTSTGNPDFCACISVRKTGEGVLETILNMNEVYGNIRIFGKDVIDALKKWWA